MLEKLHEFESRGEIRAGITAGVANAHSPAAQYGQPCLTRFQRLNSILFYFKVFFFFFLKGCRWNYFFSLINLNCSDSVLPLSLREKVNSIPIFQFLLNSDHKDKLNSNAVVGSNKNRQIATWSN